AAHLRERERTFPLDRSLGNAFPSWAHRIFESRGLPHSQTQPTTFAGTPATRACAGTSLVTTAPAPTIAFRPIRMPQRIVPLAPMDAPSATSVATTSQSGLTALGYLSFVKQACGPTKTRWPIRTPLKRAAKFWILQSSPTETFTSM